MKKLNLDNIVHDLLSGCACDVKEIAPIIKQALIEQEDITRRACGDAIMDSLDSLAYQNGKVNNDNIHGIMGYKICVGVSTIE